jgi:uncharacterized phage-associated protein
VLSAGRKSNTKALAKGRKQIINRRHSSPMHYINNNKEENNESRVYPVINKIENMGTWHFVSITSSMNPES